MKIIGLDLSLTATGMVNAEGEAFTIKNNATGMARLIKIRDRILYEADAALPADLVVIEGYSMGGQRGSAGIGQALGELGGVVRVALWEAGVPYVDVSPSSLKKYATGKGNAGKEAVLIAAIRKGADVEDNNAADAWWLRAMAFDTYGEPLVKMPQVNRSALDAVKWPQPLAVYGGAA